MATKVLNGTAWDTAGNWDGASLPIAADKVVMGATGGDVNTVTTAEGDDYAYITLPSSFRFDLASSATPIKCGAGVLQHFGSGGVYILSDANSGTVDINLVLLSGTSPSSTVEIGSNAADAGDIDHCKVSRGRLIVLGNAVFDGSAGKVTLQPLDGSDSNVFCKLSSGHGTLPLLDMYGGNCESEDAITAANVWGGTLTQTLDTITTLEIWGGVVNFNFAGTITTCTVHTGATLNLMGTGDTKTITTLNRHVGANINLDTNSGMHVITNPINHIGQEG